MATLTSPGVEVSVINESFYVPSDAGTTPLFIVASGQDKQNGAGDGTASGTTTAQANTAFLISSQRELTETFGLSYMTDTGQYSSSENLKIYYDFKHIQLNQPYQYEEGEIVDMVNPRLSKCYSKTYNCIPKPLNELEQKRISIPARRNSTFEMIEHKPEGYLEGGWKSESTRLNQIRFYNQVINNESNLTTDGLSTLKYTKVSSTSQGKYSFISVKL